MSDLVEFLRARYDEDEAVAQAATPGPWDVNSTRWPEYIVTSDGATPVAGGRWGGEASVFDSDGDAFHIVRHDPTRVLREVEAHRAILAEHSPYHSPGLGGPVCNACAGGGGFGADWPCPTVRHLLLPHIDNPDYRREWRP